MSSTIFKGAHTWILGDRALELLAMSAPLQARYSRFSQEETEGTEIQNFSVSSCPGFSVPTEARGKSDEQKAASALDPAADIAVSIFPMGSRILNSVSFVSSC